MKKRNLTTRDVPLAAGQFFGATRAQFTGGGLVATMVAHPAARVVPLHVHGNPFFSMLLHGHYREWFGGGHWDARPLAMVLRPALAEHRDEIGPGGALFLCVDIAPGFWTALADAGLRLERRAFEDRPMSCAALRLLKELREKRPGWRAVAEALVTEIAGEYLQDARGRGRHGPAWLARAREWLDRDPEHASLAGLAAELDLHPVHVARTFKRHAGLTPSAYLRQRRLLRATRALLETREAPAQLAGAHGFADQSHLTRELQRRTGWTPRRLRCACEDPA